MITCSCIKHNCNYSCVHFVVFLFFGWTGLFTVNDVHNMTDEILKMKHFDHPNVMTMIGVCVSIGGGPAIVMPYMENGSLLSYLRRDKDNIIMNDDQDLDTVSYTWLLLLSLSSTASSFMYHENIKGFKEPL